MNKDGGDAGEVERMAMEEAGMGSSIPLVNGGGDDVVGGGGSDGCDSDDDVDDDGGDDDDDGEPSQGPSIPFVNCQPPPT